MHDIGKRIVNFGRSKKVILTAMVTVIASVIISLVVSGSEINLVLAVIIPAIIIAAVSWYVIGLIVRVKHLEEHIRMLATHDVLTGAMTKRAFLETYENTYYYTQRNKLPLSLISIELDDVKKITVAFGHEVSDEILISFGNIIKEQKRKSDMFTRMEWGKFVLVLPDTGVEDAITFANKLHSLVRKTTVKSNQNDIQYTVSMGVSGFEPGNQVNLEQLIKQANVALSQAQRQGIGAVVKYTNE